MRTIASVYESKLVSIEERADRERLAREREKKIYSLLPETVAKYKFFVHAHSLYDSIGSIKIEDQRYESLREKDVIDLDDSGILELVESFGTPVLRELVRTSTLANLPRGYHKTWPESKRRHITYVTPIGGYYFDIDSEGYLNLKFTTLHGLDVKIVIPRDSVLNNLVSRRVIWSDHRLHRYRKIERVDVERVPHVINSAGKRVADTGVTKYASGNPGNTPSRIRLSFGPYPEVSDVTIRDLFHTATLNGKKA